MCESKVYMRENGEEKLIAEDVISLTPKENAFIFVDISGSKYEVHNAVIEYIDFINHKVVLKKVE